MPHVQIKMDGDAIQGLVDDIVEWIKDPDTNISKLARLSGMTRVTLQRIRADQGDLMVSTLVILANAYHEYQDDLDEE